MIEIRNLFKTYTTKTGTVAAVNDVSLSISSGEIFGIVGYSGAGKSSLLRCINLLERPSAGTVLVDGKSVTELNGTELRLARQKSGMIFQHFCLISQKTVFENIAFALRAAGVSRAQITPRVEELLALVGLSDKRNAYPSQLSGGQQQRVAIARALANNPRILLCDEATSALDPTTTKSILELLKSVNRQFNLTIVLITHQMNVVKEICDHVAVMQEGKIIEQGSVYDVFASPATELAKEFISSVVSFEIPAPILKNCTGPVVKIIFRGPVAGESVISDMLKRFEVSGNFLHGSIEYIQGRPLGIFIMELRGKQEQIRSAIAYIEGRNVRTEVLSYGI